MTDTLLFLHVLSAAALVAGVVGFSAVALGARMESGQMALFTVLWRVGLLGTILFGIALALDIDGYEIWDAWILIAIGLWLVVGGPGEQLPKAYRESGGSALPQRAVTAHWLTVAIVVLLLADMIWKPWA